ncbi:MAG: helix-turn-helix domain-containing protein [Flavobacteriales bacterium]
MFFVFGIGIAIFLELLLILKKNKSVADHVLGAWLLLDVLHLSLFYLNYSDAIFDYPHLAGLGFGMPTAQGVFLFLYAKALTTGSLSWKTIVFHLLPAFLIYIFATPFFILSAEEKVCVMENKGAGYEWFVYLNNTVMIITGFSYAIWTFLLTKRYSKIIRTRFSNIDKKELNWLKYLSIAMSIIWITVLFSDKSEIIFGVVVLFIFFIGGFGINQMSIFSSQPETSEIKVVDFESSNIHQSIEVVDEVVDTPEKPKKRYAKSGLTAEKSDIIFGKLNQIMATDKLFLNNELTLSQLAEALETPSNHLSQVINEKGNKNFYTYINTLRVNEFIRISKLPENKNITLIAMAYESGFNSKSTFNKHFKAVIGKTPQEYLNNENI